MKAERLAREVVYRSQCGIETGESKIESAARKVSEETGYMIF